MGVFLLTYRPFSKLVNIENERAKDVVNAKRPGREDQKVDKPSAVPGE